MRSTIGTLTAFVLAGILQAVPASAQIQNPLQVFKDAYNKAKQQAQQQQQPANAPSAQPASALAGAAADSGAASAQAPSGDCCNPEALKTYATGARFLDIVGIKLGMTPEQTTAAIKAYDPGLKVDLLNSRLQHPTQRNFVPVPHYIRAYTANRNAQNGQVEDILVMFTTPPGPPLVQEVQRDVVFHVGEPVLSGNLLASLRQKYGQENAEYEGPVWVYDLNGKLRPRVSGQDRSCEPTGNLSVSADPSDPTHDARDEISLQSTADSPNGRPTSGCVPFLYAQAWRTGAAPNQQVVQMTVAIKSGALSYDSMKATHDWLQAEADAKAKQQQDAAAQRTGPKL